METDHIQLARLVDMATPNAILKEVKTIVSMMFSKFDFSHLETAFSSIEALFQGRYPGYRGCNTLYHDLSHTTEVLLAMTRLIHGAFVEGICFTEKETNMGLISALMHDTGYIQTSDDLTGTGAKYTLNHIRRSIDFMLQFYREFPYFSKDLNQFVDIFNCTGLSTRIKEIPFSSSQIEMIGKMLGTADLLGQMADRYYLEKITHLYKEFMEGNIKGFDSEFDLFQKTIGFFEVTKRRFDNELGNVNLYARVHFRERWQINSNLYIDSIERNIAYLKWVIDNHPNDYRLHFRRTYGISH